MIGEKKMRIDIIFCNGYAFNDYEIKDYKLESNWLLVKDMQDGISYINLDNVNVYTLYEDEKEND